MPGQGTVSINFGAFPGTTDTTVAVTGQTGIIAGSLVEAWILPADTADHSSDEHWMDPPKVMAGTITPGVGFLVYGLVANDPPPDNNYLLRGPVSRNIRTYGVWNVAWCWN